MSSFFFLSLFFLKKEKCNSHRLLQIGAFFLRCVLHINDAVESPPAPEQLPAHLALDAHQDKCGYEANRIEDQLDPPPQHISLYLPGRELVQEPRHTHDRKNKANGEANHLTLLYWRHVQSLPLK